MTVFDWGQLILFLGLLVAATPFLGSFIAKVMAGEKHVLSRPFGFLEPFCYRIGGVDAQTPMTARQYVGALMVFNLVGIVFVFLLQLLQGLLPLNPQGFGAVSWHSALNTAVSFVTNTNWQGYAGETTMSYFTQMTALTVQNFLSAAVGLAVAVAAARGIAARSTGTLGNFWADLVRSTVYLLLPGSILYALFLIGQGVVQNFSAYLQVATLEGAAQLLPMGPAASQVSIKMLGTNGGGFFNANSAFPFENPTPLSNFVQMFSILVIPAALTYTYGTITRARRHGWVLFGVMMTLFVAMTLGSLWSEFTHNPVMGVTGLMEGKETRFGLFNSNFFSVITTSASCGAINSLHSSLSPLSGGIAMLNMMLGEIIFGGVGAGLYGMLLFVLLTVFIAGLMVGRTPEYLGKKIESREMTMVILAVLAPCACILVGTAISAVVEGGLSSLANTGPHGFSEILYAFTSAAANNGSAFAGLNANTPYYNVMLALAMFVGRFAVIVPILIAAGSLSVKPPAPPSAGTFETDSAFFGGLLIAVILIVGALTFIPALSLGPIVEHMMMIRGQAL